MNKNSDIKDAVEELDSVSQNERTGRIAELREKAIRDEKAALSYATKEGIKQGIKTGKLEMSKELLKEGIELSVIEKISGLSKEELDRLQDTLSEK